MKSFKDLEVWKVAEKLLEEIYELTENFPQEENYIHKQQMRKAAVSIVGNIAEGCGRFTYADKANKFVIARGECTELAAYIHSSTQVKLLTKEKIEQAQNLLERTGRLLSGIIASCNKRKLDTKTPVTNNQ